MEILKRDNETLAAYVHHLKTEAKRCDFNSDTTNIHILIKGLQDTHNIVAKIYEKDTQTLMEVIKLVQKLNVAQQVTANLIPPTVNVMLNNDRCFVFSKTGHIGCPLPQCTVLKLWRLWPLCPGLSRQDCPISNTLLPW